MLTAPEAAARLGVKQQTLYAYVSRGVLRRHRAEDGRTSLFSEAEIAQLAARGRPRRSTQPVAVDFPIRTAITAIEAGVVRYRGQDSRRLARTASFEQVAELLWTGRLPAAHTPWPSAARTAVAPAGADLPDALRRALCAPADGSPDASAEGSTAPASSLDTARELLSAAVDSLPVLGDGRTPRLSLPAGTASLRASLAGRLWVRLTAATPRPDLVGVLNSALVLVADHEMAPSTFAARIAASTRADLQAVLMAGLGVLAGPLHGGASRPVHDLLQRAAPPVDPDAIVAEWLGRAGVRPGFGHPLYADGDPRATELLEQLRRVLGRGDRTALVDTVVAAARRRGLEPNLDFALAALAFVIRAGADAGPAIFAIGRSAGWIAHALEEYEEAPARFRPRASVRPPAQGGRGLDTSHRVRPLP